MMYIINFEEASGSNYVVTVDVDVDDDHLKTLLSSKIKTAPIFSKISRLYQLDKRGHI